MVGTGCTYHSLEEFQQHIQALNLELPLSTDLEVLQRATTIGGRQIPNGLAINPMEGCDGTTDGKPDQLTIRRYERFARGGAGLLWVEAAAVVQEGRANPRQLYLCADNLQAFSELNTLIRSVAQAEFGPSYRPFTVLQLTHSGRYSKPTKSLEPIIGTANPFLDGFLPSQYHQITDAELEVLEDSFAESAVLAKAAGFDAVDIKSCHRYLNSELLSGLTREGKYGGSFENRTRFLRNVVDKIHSRLDDSLEITLRLNVYDAIPYPYGWGVSREDVTVPDLREPIELLKILRDKGVRMVNISCGNPYYNPHVGRPYDQGPYRPPEHPLVGVAKMLGIIRDIQAAVPDLVAIATGLSWLREYGALVAAGGIQAGWFRIAGFGRQGFAYPDFARDILLKGKMERKKCCIACSKCTEIMRDGGETGCVIRDHKVYGPIYNMGRQGKPPITGDHLAEHI